MLSQSIQDYLGSRHNLITLAKTDTESLTDNLFYQQISYVLTIPKGFEAQFLTDTPLKLSHSIRQDNANGLFVNEQLNSSYIAGPQYDIYPLLLLLKKFSL